MDPSEVEFIAEKTAVEIIPNFTYTGVMHLISGNVGPFRPGLPLVVPLWLAMNLKQRSKCRILAPNWMDIEKLEEKKEEEKNSKFFTKMPNEHYLEVAHMLLGIASDDIEHADEIRTAVKDLWDMRISKLRSSVNTFIKSGGVHASLDHLTQLEINSIRPILPDGLNALQSLNEESDSEQEDNADSSQNTTRHTLDTSSTSLL